MQFRKKKTRKKKKDFEETIPVLTNVYQSPFYLLILYLIQESKSIQGRRLLSELIVREGGGSNVYYKDV